jgi:hypothetical protein
MNAVRMLGMVAFILSLMSSTTLPAESLPLRKLAHGAFGGIQTAKREVIKDQSAWDKLWAQHAQPVNEPEKPKVDFSKEMVILVAMGRKTTGGHSIEITSVKPDRDHLIITVKSSSPPPGAFATQALTAPFHIVAVPRSELKPKFVEQ